MPGWRVIHDEFSCFAPLQSCHAFLVHLWKRQVVVQDEIRAREGRVGVVGELGSQYWGPSEACRPFRSFGRLEIVEEELFSVDDRAKPYKAMFLRLKQHGELEM